MRALPVLAGAALLAAATATRAYVPGAGIAGTPHDWSGGNATALLQWVDRSGNVTTYNTGTPYVDPTSGKQGVTKVTVGQCTTCHTPQRTKSASLAWNSTLPSTAYRWDVPATTAGTPYPTFQADTYKGPTAKCLSCHDGLLASTDGMWFNRAAATGVKAVAVAGTQCDGHNVAEGANLSKTHPVAMPYPINGVPNTYNFVRNGAQIACTEWVADPMRANRLPLYNDDGAGNIVTGVVAGRTGIECSSCHDVHNGSGVTESFLLLGKLSGSDRGPGGYLCTQCHAK